MSKSDVDDQQVKNGFEDRASVEQRREMLAKIKLKPIKETVLTITIHRFIYLLHDSEPPRVVKYFPQKEEANFKQECTILKKLVHPNIVRYLDTKTQPTSSRHGILMEYCREGSLDKIITDRTWEYSTKTGLCWSYQLFMALEWLRSKEILHNHIMPKNLFLAEDFTLKLGGFGHSCTYDPKDTITYASDLYSAGLVVWKMLERGELYKIDIKPERFESSTEDEIRTLMSLITRCTDEQSEGKVDCREAREIVEKIGGTANLLAEDYPKKSNRKKQSNLEASEENFVEELLEELLKLEATGFDNNQQSRRLEDDGLESTLTFSNNSQVPEAQPIQYRRSETYDPLMRAFLPAGSLDINWSDDEDNVDMPNTSHGERPGSSCSYSSHASSSSLCVR